MQGKFWLSIREFLFPPRCIFCRKPLDHEDICEDCLKELPLVTRSITNQTFTTKICAPLYYEGVVRRAIIRYKFHGATAYTEPFAKLICDVVKAKINDNIDYVTWVSLGAKKLRRRGYDQALLIAEEVSKQMDIPLIKTLKKIRNNKSQHKIKNYEQRRANVVGVYATVNEDEIFGKKVLLIDDVFTTGATIYECSRVLKTAGVTDIYVATIAKTPSKSKKRLKKVKNSL